MANLISFVEEEAEVGENNPQLLPTVAVLELAQKIATKLVLNDSKHHLTELKHRKQERRMGSRSLNANLDCEVVVAHAHTRVTMPTHVHGSVGAVLNLLLRRRSVATLVL